MIISITSSSKFNQIIPHGNQLKRLISAYSELGHSVFFRWDRPVPIGSKHLILVFGATLYVKHDKDFIRDLLASGKEYMLWSTELLRYDGSGFNWEEYNTFNQEEQTLFCQLVERARVVACHEQDLAGYRLFTEKVTVVNWATHVPSLPTIVPNSDPPIDVLFFGSLAPERQKIIQAVEETGLQVVTLGYTDEIVRDSFVANSKVVLALTHKLEAHYKIRIPYGFSRIAYLAHNSVCCVAEKPDFVEREYGGLVETVDRPDDIPEFIVDIVRSRKWYPLGLRANRRLKRGLLSDECERVLDLGFAEP